MCHINFQIIEKCFGLSFGLIGPQQYDAQIHIGQKILGSMGSSNLGPTGLRLVFYHYTNNFPADISRFNDYQAIVMSTCNK